MLEEGGETTSSGDRSRICLPNPSPPSGGCCRGLRALNPRTSALDPGRVPKTYLFDLDGTLLDSIALILASFHHTRRVHYGDALPDSTWLAGIGRTLWDVFADMADDAAQVDAMVATYRAHNLANHDAMVRPYPGVVEVVEALAARGARMAIVTSKVRVGAERGLTHLGLLERFPVRVCADDVVRGKPDPEPVRRALSALGSAPEDAVFVGDSPHDMEAGQRAGVATAAALWGPFERTVLEAHRPTRWLSHPADLLRDD